MVLTLNKYLNKIRNLFELTGDEDYYFDREYSAISYDSPAMVSFLNEIYKTIKKYITLKNTTSLLDVGCGRGYFLRYLYDKNFKKIRGIDPSKALLKKKLFSNISWGSFNTNSFKNNEFNIVFTCHTLHHLADKAPVFAVKEMLRIAKDYIVIVEINNNNLPMLLISLLNWRVEKNAFRYNKKKVFSLLPKTKIIFAGDMKTSYISGNSLPYKLLSRMGSYPYNIIIAKKVSDYE